MSYSEELFGGLVALVEAVELNSQRGEVAEYRTLLDTFHWRREFRTVRFGMARRMGHTSLAAELCLHRKESGPTLVLALGSEQADILREKVQGTAEVVSFIDIESVSDKEYALVILDGASAVSSWLLDYIYKTWAGDPLFLLLG